MRLLVPVDERGDRSPYEHRAAEQHRLGEPEGLPHDRASTATYIWLRTCRYSPLTTRRAVGAVGDGVRSISHLTDPRGEILGKREPQRVDPLLGLVLVLAGSWGVGGSVRLTVFVHTGLVVFCLSLS